MRDFPHIKLQRFLNVDTNRPYWAIAVYPRNGMLVYINVTAKQAALLKAVGFPTS